MNKIIFLLSIFFSFQILARTEICPRPSPSDVAPKVSVKVHNNKKAKLYTYEYSVENNITAKVPIWRFSIEADSAPLSTLGPKGWEKGVYDRKAQEIYWVYNANLAQKNYIRAGQKISGFQVVSKRPPSIVKAFVEGDAPETPYVKFEDEEDEKDPDSIACPGFFNGSGNSDYSVMATQGPQISNRVEAKIRIKKSDAKVWLGSLNTEPDIELSPLDYGQLELIVFGQPGIDVNTIDFNSIQFGPGKATYVPVRKSIIDEFKDVSDNEIFKFLQKNKKSQHLTLAFNLQEVEVRCNIENALFFTAKMGKKELMGAVNIKPVQCDPKTFEREAQKPNKYIKNKD